MGVTGMKFGFGAACAAVVAVTLAACSYDDGVGRFDPRACAPSVPDVGAVDWTKVATVDVRVRQSEVDPMIINLRQNTPYVLRIQNSDEGTRTLRAHQFFRSVHLVETSIGGEMIDTGCYESVHVGAGGSAEVRFITGQDGRYNFQLGAAPWPVVLPDAGAIVIN